MKTNLINSARRAFTVVELLVVMAVLFGLALLLTPALARTRKDNLAAQCLNNHRQLVQAWKMFAVDNQDNLVAAQANIPGRPKWITGDVGLEMGTSPSHFDYQQDIAKSPLWPYTEKNPDIFRCPSDQSTVVFAGPRLRRVRSVSMSQVFGNGEWLNGGPNSGQTVYRTYSKLGAIAKPTNTFVLLDEHPVSINDSAFAVQCAGAQPNQAPGGERIIDFPASFHNGGCTFSFADGHAEIHTWESRQFKPPAFYQAGKLQLNVVADDDAARTDVRWLADNTTVKR